MCIRDREYPQYTPDFIKLAESYRAKGIRVTKKEEIAAAFKEAKKNTKAPGTDEQCIRNLQWRRKSDVHVCTVILCGCSEVSGRQRRCTKTDLAG